MTNLDSVDGGDPEIWHLPTNPDSADRVQPPSYLPKGADKVRHLFQVRGTEMDFLEVSEGNQSLVDILGWVGRSCGKYRGREKERKCVCWGGE